LEEGPSEDSETREIPITKRQIPSNLQLPNDQNILRKIFLPREREGVKKLRNRQKQNKARKDGSLGEL
jgi:hypothetical protein